MKKILTIMISLAVIISMMQAQWVFAETGTVKQKNDIQSKEASQDVVIQENDIQTQKDNQDITIKITVDDASEKLLNNKDKCKMFISDGDQEKIAEKKDGVWQATLPLGEHNNLTIGFGISREYFIPAIKVNGKVMETFSWPSPDEKITNIGISMPMSEVGDGKFNLDLTFGKSANLDPEWLKLVSGIKNMDVSYLIDDEGVEIVPDNVDVTFKAKDTDKDKLVSDAVATYDFSVLMDDQAQSELIKPVDVTLELDKSSFTEDDYVVVRNHEGKREIIDSEYRADEHVLSFSSDRFSTYTIAKAGAKILPEENGEKVDSSVAKGSIETGDMNNMIVLGLILVISLVLGFCFKRKRHHIK